MEESARNRNWAEAWRESGKLTSLREIDTLRVNKLKLDAATELLRRAQDASTRADWKQAHDSLEPLSASFGIQRPHSDPLTGISGFSLRDFNRGVNMPNLLAGGQAVGKAIETPTGTGIEALRVHGTGIPSRPNPVTGQSAGGGSISPAIPLGVRPYPTKLPSVADSLAATLSSGSDLYAQAGVQLAEQAVHTGNYPGAVHYFREAFKIRPQLATVSRAALFKKASFQAADGEYLKGQWESASDAYQALRDQTYVSLSLEEQGLLSAQMARAQNRVQAVNLPAGTVVIDRISVPPSGGRNAASYFHAFGGAGGLDVFVKATTIDEFFSNDSFRPVVAELSRGDDLVVTPTVSSNREWGAALQERLPEVTIWSDPYLGDTSMALSSLEQTTVKPEDLSIAVLLPKDANQQSRMNLPWSDGQRRRALDVVDYLLSNAPGITNVTQPTNRMGLWGWATSLLGTDSKAAVMQSLETKKGVVILFAHGDREGAYTPEGQKLTVDDIRSLDLSKNRPAVLLLSCEGGSLGPSNAEPSLARVLKERGATCVWSYDRKADVAEAASLAVKMITLVREGKNLLETFRILSKDKGTKAGPPVRLKAQNQKDLDQWPEAEINFRVIKTSITREVLAYSRSDC